MNNYHIWLLYVIICVLARVDVCVCLYMSMCMCRSDTQISALGVSPKALSILLFEILSLTEPGAYQFI